MKAIAKILKARSILILDHPFFGSLALRLGLTEDDRFETASVNEKELRYNPNYIKSLSTGETTGLLAHEVMHIALGHIWREDERERKRWIAACDYAINENLINAGFTLPKGALIEERYYSLSAEEIYNLLPQQDKRKGKGDDGEKDKQKSNGDEEVDRTDPGKCGGVIPIKEEEEKKEERKEKKAEWQATINQAIQISEGSLLANIKRQIQVILNPAIPWHILLRDFVEKTARNDYDWTRPSRRYIGRGIILPSLISEQLPEVAIAIDTSGSIDQDALSKFITEASNVLGAYDTTIRIIYCNNRIQKEEIFTRADLPMKLNPIGGGGTDFNPVFEHITKQNITPACLIYFTDLHGRFPKQEPEYPTMWLTTTKDKKAPFGITVQFEN